MYWPKNGLVSGNMGHVGYPTIMGFWQTWNLQTKSVRALLMNPWGCSMSTSSLKFPWRKAFDTFNCQIFQSKLTAKANIIRMVKGLIIGLKVSVRAVHGLSRIGFGPHLTRID